MDASSISADLDLVDDSALPDATMMDPTMDPTLDPTMDDLFGEAADSLAVPLPPVPLPGSLVVRIAEMQSFGCSTKLAWSNTGSIAQISPDGTKITFRAMIRSKKTGMWGLSEPFEDLIEAPEGRRFVHVQFSSIGIDLAIVDDRGLVHMYNLVGALSKMTCTNGDMIQNALPANELATVVGMHWLALYPVEFRTPYIDIATKNGDKWRAFIRQRDSSSPKVHNPAEGRYALLQVTRGAKLTLRYQNEGQPWHTTTITLDTAVSSNDLVSHADIGEDGNDLLVVTRSYSSRLRLYRLKIDWNVTQHTRQPSMPQNPQQNSQQNLPPVTSVAPTLDLARLATIDNVQTQQIDSAGLTHLRIIPVPPEFVSDSPSLPMIVAVFTHAPLSTTATPFSVIARWRIESSSPVLHESFKKLKSGGTVTAAKNKVTRLRRDPDLLPSKVILAMESQIFHTLLVFGGSDGSIEMRDRTNMDIVLPTFGEVTTVTSLVQAGFEHLAADHNLHIALSPDSSGLACMRADNKVLAHAMNFRLGWQLLDDDLTSNRSSIEAAAASIARQYALLCWNYVSNDESLALLPFDASLEIRSLVIKDIYHIMNRSLDISLQEVQKQQVLLLRDPVAPKLLSAQLALGTNPVSGERNFTAQFAFVVLNFRHIATGLAPTLARLDGSRTALDAVHSFRGIARWCLDLVVSVVNNLFGVKRSIDSGTPATEAIAQHTAANGDPSVHLVLCSFSRALFRFIIVTIARYFQALPSVIPRATSVNQKQDLIDTVELVNKLPFRINLIENLLSETDQMVRRFYNTNSTPAARRGELEINMTVDGTLPDELNEVVVSLLGPQLDKLAEGVDMQKLYFWDTSWLMLSRSFPPEGHEQYDVIRKTPLRKDMILRVCRRCGSQMEDFPHEKAREQPYWLVHAQRHCICMNYWIMAGK